jgi:hypothetical protein
MACGNTSRETFLNVSSSAIALRIPSSSNSVDGGQRVDHVVELLGREARRVAGALEHLLELDLRSFRLHRGLNRFLLDDRGERDPRLRGRNDEAAQGAAQLLGGLDLSLRGRRGIDHRGHRLLLGVRGRELRHLVLLDLGRGHADGVVLLLQRAGIVLGRLAGGSSSLAAVVGVTRQALQLRARHPELADEPLRVTDQLYADDDVVHFCALASFLLSSTLASISIRRRSSSVAFGSRTLWISITSRTRE